MAHATTRAFADERRSAIMEMLEHNASVQVAEIAQTFGVSSVTARADLDALAESGKLRRTHGGAVSLQKRLTVSTQDRRINVNVAAKQAIAQSAIELVNDGDTLLVDSGTTALEFVRLLDQRDGITVITADITIALSDQPGQLSGVSSIIAEHGANVVSVNYDSTDLDMNITDCFLKLGIETRDNAHIESIKQALTSAGFEVCD